MRLRQLCLVLALVSSAAARGEAVREDRELLHTIVTVVLADPRPDGGVEAAFDDAFQVFSDIDETMNEWRPGSALVRRNRPGSSLLPPCGAGSRAGCSAAAGSFATSCWNVGSCTAAIRHGFPILSNARNR